MGKERAARGSCNYARAKRFPKPGKGCNDIVARNRAYFWVALAYGITFGAILFHWLVVA